MAGQDERALSKPEDEILGREDRLLAVVSPEGEGEPVAEVTFRQTTVGGGARRIVICEVCVTTIENGVRTTVCKSIPCPKGGGGPAKPPTTIRV
jgi:hypothetical protein